VTRSHAGHGAAVIRVGKLEVTPPLKKRERDLRCLAILLHISSCLRGEIESENGLLGEPYYRGYLITGCNVGLIRLIKPKTSH